MEKKETKEKLLEEEEEDPPIEFICPISREIMQDPVCIEDGSVYDRRFIELWLSSSSISPLTNLPLKHKNVCSRRDILQLIKKSKFYKPSAPPPDLPTCILKTIPVPLLPPLPLAPPPDVPATNPFLGLVFLIIYEIFCQVGLLICFLCLSDMFSGLNIQECENTGLCVASMCIDVVDIIVDGSKSYVYDLYRSLYCIPFVRVCFI